MKSLHLKILIGAFLLCIFSALFILLRADEARADSFNLYATECIGGFDNAENASGTPSVSGKQVSMFNESNSAVLPAGRSGEIKCSNFAGQILRDVTPKKVTLKFSWAATYSKSEILVVPSPENTEDTIIENSASSTISPTSSSTEIAVDPEVIEVIKEVTPAEVTPQEEKIEVKEIAPAPSELPVENISVPAVEVSAPPVSFFRLLGSIAFAEEMPSSTIDVPVLVETKEPEILPLITEATSTPPDILPPSDVPLNAQIDSNASSSVESDSYGIVAVEYSLNGILWTHLGNVDIDKFDESSFELSLEQPIQLKSLSDIQVRISRLPTTDGVSPYIYIDSIWLDVEYDKEVKELHPAPNEDNGDILEGSVLYEDKVAVLVKRPSFTPIQDNEDSIFSSSTASSSSATTYKTELWLTDNSTSTDKIWTFVADDELVGEGTKVFFDFGYVIWVSKGKSLWMFNPKSVSYESVSIEESLPTYYNFKDQAGNTKVLIITQPNNMIAFEDYVSVEE